VISSHRAFAHDYKPESAHCHSRPIENKESAMKILPNQDSQGPLALPCVLFLFLLSFTAPAGANKADPPPPPFEGQQDVGTVLHPGSMKYDPAAQTYTISASGENMWFQKDAFYFAWKKVSGDVSVAADISFLGVGKNPHRKAVLMIRQSLEPDSPYVDIALHGNGMTSLQFRDAPGDLTHEIIAAESMPARLLIEKRGENFVMLLPTGNGSPKNSGASIRIPIKGTFYVGIGVCSHEKDLVETAVFSDVKIGVPPAVSQPQLYSTLETIAIDSTDRQVIYAAPGHFEAPNWSRDGSYFLFNREGLIQKIPATGGTPEKIDTGFAARCNNDHGISPDGHSLVISDQSQEDHRSLLYTLLITGGTPRRITKNAPSYWHGWSPDGKTLAFVGERNGDFDIYAIPVEGGEETRLTTAKGLDDGPEYSPDGNYIYFNSERTGQMQIWRMHPDGSQQEQITKDEYNNWFPHISPDGKWMVILSYDKSVSGHPENKEVQLRLISLSDGKITAIAKLFGGQGTINVPSWSPDSKHFAFVSYQLAP
jgi:TolB protein